MEKLPERKDIKKELTWNLEDIYKSDEAWEKDFKKIQNLAKSFPKYEGKLCESAKTLLSFYSELTKFNVIAEKLFTYVMLRCSEDNSASKYTEMRGRANFALMNISASVSFAQNEIIKAGEKKIKAFVEEEPKLKDYDFEFKELFRQKKHVLSQKEERLLALSAAHANTGDDVFTMFNNADLKFGTIKNAAGKKVELTKGNYSSFIESKNRDVRKNAFKEMYAAYKAYINTIAACYAGNVKAEYFYASVRKYGSSIEASLDSDKIPVSVYDNLIQTVHDNMDKLTEYLKHRKKAMGLKELHMYDLYVPIVEVPTKKYTYEEAQKLVLAAVAPLGKDYCKVIERAFKERWIDVCENKGKTSGAFSCGVYGVHPYILLNWQGTINDVFTLAHELGHTMHSYYSNQKQPYAKSNYKIFVAEVASTVNENLLLDYFLKNTKNKKERTYILNHYLEEFRATVYRQVMFAEFEKKAHAVVGAGGALTAESLSDMYYELNKEFFAAAVKVDEDIKYEWARIPHFYNSFYVYKYATGFSAAVALAKGILSGDKKKIKAYRDFLAAGGSDYPIEELKAAGVDLSTPKPVQDALDVFYDNVKTLEAETK